MRVFDHTLGAGECQDCVRLDSETFCEMESRLLFDSFSNCSMWLFATDKGFKPQKSNHH